MVTARCLLPFSTGSLRIVQETKNWPPSHRDTSPNDDAQISIASHYFILRIGHFRWRRFLGQPENSAWSRVLAIRLDRRQPEGIVQNPNIRVIIRRRRDCQEASSSGTAHHASPQIKSTTWLEIEVHPVIPVRCHDARRSRIVAVLSPRHIDGGGRSSIAPRDGSHCLPGRSFGSCRHRGSSKLPGSFCGLQRKYAAMDRRSCFRHTNTGGLRLHHSPRTSAESEAHSTSRQGTR